MSFRDFMTYFGELEICHLTPDSVNNEDTSKKFEVFHFYGAWKSGSTAGGCGNDGNRKKISDDFFLTRKDHFFFRKRFFFKSPNLQKKYFKLLS